MAAVGSVEDQHLFVLSVLDLMAIGREVWDPDTFRLTRRWLRDVFSCFGWAGRVPRPKHVPVEEPSDTSIKCLFDKNGAGGERSLAAVRVGDESPRRSRLHAGVVCVGQRAVYGRASLSAPRVFDAGRGRGQTVLVSSRSICVRERGSCFSDFGSCFFRGCVSSM